MRYVRLTPSRLSTVQGYISHIVKTGKPAHVFVEEGYLRATRNRKRIDPAEDHLYVDTYHIVPSRDTLREKVRERVKEEEKENDNMFSTGLSRRDSE